MSDGGRILYGWNWPSLAVIVGLSISLWSLLIGISWVLWQAGS